MIKLLVRILKELKIVLQEAVFEYERSHHHRGDISIKPMTLLQKKNILVTANKGAILIFILKIFWQKFLILTKKEKLCFFISLGCIFLIPYNLYTAFSLFYQTHNIRKIKLNNLGIFEYDLQYREIFLTEVPELYFLHQIEIFLLIFLWKLLCALLMIVPILLIIAYSTVLERKILSAVQRR